MYRYDSRWRAIASNSTYLRAGPAGEGGGPSARIGVQHLMCPLQAHLRSNTNRNTVRGEGLGVGTTWGNMYTRVNKQSLRCINEAPIQKQ